MKIVIILINPETYCSHFVCQNNHNVTFFTILCILSVTKSMKHYVHQYELLQQITFHLDPYCCRALNVSCSDHLLKHYNTMYVCTFPSLRSHLE